MLFFATLVLGASLSALIMIRPCITSRKLKQRDPDPDLGRDISHVSYGG